MKRWLSGLWVLVGASMLQGVSTDAYAAPAWMEVNGVSLRYELTGQGDETLVLLPGTGRPLEYWDELLPAFQAPNRKVLRYDLRGVGLSQRLTEPITLQDEVDDLRALLDALEIKGPVMMVGSAFGGTIQMLFASQFPKRVKGVVNVSPTAQLVGTPGRPAPAYPRPASASVDRHAVTYPEKLRGNEARWKKYLALQASNDPLSKKLMEQLIYSTSFADVLPRIECPLLLVATTSFVGRTVESVQAMADAAQDGRLAVIDSGHDATFQTPELVLPLLNAFFKELDF